MTTDDPALRSLLRALQPNFERPVPAAAWEGFARRFLHPGETVLLALRGEGLTWVDSLLLVTDSRVIRFREVLRWRKVREVPAAEVSGAELAPGFLTGAVRIHLRSGAPLRMRPDMNRGEAARIFVDGINGLLSGRGPASSA